MNFNRLHNQSCKAYDAVFAPLLTNDKQQFERLVSRGLFVQWMMEYQKGKYKVTPSLIAQ